MIQRNINKEKVFAQNLGACKHYYNAVVQYMEYHKTNSINAAQMRMICKSLGMSNMMPTHFVDGGLMVKNNVFRKNRWAVIYSFTNEFFTIEQFNVVADLKMNYVQKVKVNKKAKEDQQEQLYEEQEHIQTSMDEFCQPQPSQPKDGKPVQTQIEFPAQEPQVDSNALKSVILFLIDNLKKLL